MVLFEQALAMMLWSDVTARVQDGSRGSLRPPAQPDLIMCDCEKELVYRSFP